MIGLVGLFKPERSFITKPGIKLGGSMKKLLIVLVGMLFCFPIQAKKEKEILINFYDLTPETKRQVECLAKNIYYEAGAESPAGQAAIAFVTLNRVKLGFGPDICSVVHAKVKSICQFSWWCETKRAINYKKFEASSDIALQVYLNYELMYDITHGSTHFHNTTINPNWKDLKRTVKIGNHIFYKLKKDPNAKEIEYSVKQYKRPVTELVYVTNGGYFTPVVQASN
jgi:Cell Wall Hydrolase